jgi:flagellar biosynthesis protein
LVGEVVQVLDDGTVVVGVGPHRVPTEGQVEMTVGQRFQFEVEGSGETLQLRILEHPQIAENSLIRALRRRLGDDLPVGRLLNELTAKLRSTLTGGSGDAAVLRLMNQLGEHTFQPGTDGYMLRDIVLRSGLGLEAALSRASDYMLEGDIQPPTARALAAAWVRGVAGESVIRPATARQLEEKLVRELNAIRREGEVDLTTVMRRLGEVMIKVLLARSCGTLRDSILARADGLASNGEFPERELALLRVWLGMPSGVSERAVTLWLAQAVLTPWLRDLKARLLCAKAQLEDGVACKAVDRTLAGLEAEQLLNLARAKNGEGWLASFPIPDGDVRGSWTTAHLLHRSGSEAVGNGVQEAAAGALPTQLIVVGVDFSRLGPLRAELLLTGTSVTLKLVVDRPSTASVMRRRLVELHSLFEGAEAQVELSVVQGSPGDASVEALLRDIKYVKDHHILADGPNPVDNGVRPVSAEEALAKQISDLRAAESAPSGYTARGSGTAPDRMFALARKEGIPVPDDQDLLTLLATSEIGEEIPVELYEVVASLLTYLYRLEG